MSRGTVFSRLATLLTVSMKIIPAGFGGVSRPLLRFWRLAWLRSSMRGFVPATTQFDGPVTACGSGELYVGEHCRLGRDVHLDTCATGAISLGNRVRINSGGVIVANLRVLIGDDTLIGEYVSIRDANHGISGGTLIRTQPLVAAEVKIGRDVWIGRGACVLKGVTIGDGAVVGANSVVTHDLAPGAVCAGVPARQLGSRDITHLASQEPDS